MEEKKKLKEKLPLVIPKTTTDFQRLKLERLMKDPSKPVLIPDPPKERKVHEAPEFVRNVMGSSAGAGSGEFHVYRHLRRKEYSRQKFIEERARKEQLDENYHKKIEQNKLDAEMRTAKKRQKRQKKKIAKTQRKKNPVVKKEVTTESSSDEDEDGEKEIEESDNDSSADHIKTENNTNTTTNESTLEANGQISDSARSFKGDLGSVVVIVTEKDHSLETMEPTTTSKLLPSSEQEIKDSKDSLDHSPAEAEETSVETVNVMDNRDSRDQSPAEAKEKTVNIMDSDDLVNPRVKEENNSVQTEENVLEKDPDN